MSLVRSSYCLVACLQWMMLAPLVAEEVSAGCEAKPCQAECGTPVLRLPYVSRLFKNVGIAACEHVAACGANCCERIGVDFDLTLADGESNCCELASRTTADGHEQVQVCRASNRCQEADCCQAGQACESSANASMRCPPAWGEISSSMVASGCNVHNTENHPATLSCPVLKLAAENAGLKAQLGMRDALAKQQLELFGAAVEAREEMMEMQSAAVQQQLEFMEAMIELRVENAALQAKLEFAQQREEMVRQFAATQIENANLKRHVEILTRRDAERTAELTSQQDAAENPERTASPQRDKRRAARPGKVVR